TLVPYTTLFRSILPYRTHLEDSRRVLSLTKLPYPRVLSQNECFRGYPETSLFLILPHFAVAVEQFVETVAIACFAALIAAFVGQLGVQELLRLSQSRNPVQSQQ